MNPVTRREALGLVAAAGAATAAAAGEQPAKKPNGEPPVHSQSKPDKYGPRELFAVVDQDGTLKRGLHAVSAQRLGVGVYEVCFARDVRRGAYLATAGGHGYEGIPLSASAAVCGRASDPCGVLVYMTDNQGDPLSTGF